VPAAARIQSSGCLLLTALLLAGCGGGRSGAAVTGSEATVTRAPVTTTPDPRLKGRREKSGRATGDPCQGQLGSFVASMDSLRRRLAVGLTYDRYVAEVRGIRSTYAKISIGRVALGCLDRVGTPAEKAFNRYIEAANDWGGCVSEAGCSSAAIEPVLQRRWRIASHFLSEADEGLSAGAP
jgi:hypothetical protein